MERRPKSPSRRQPHRSWYFNEADVLERQMQEYGHRTWGYVIYRTTYASDDDCAEFPPAPALPHGGKLRQQQRPGHPRTLHPDRLLRFIALRRRRHAHDSRAFSAMSGERISRRAAAA